MTENSIAKETLKLPFCKMHGIGNDYLYISTIPQAGQSEPEWCSDPARVGRLALKASDRHFGIGSDGLVLIRPSDQADIMMDMYNSDGSRGKMCGNAIRCVAKYAYERGLVRKSIMDIETLSGVRRLELELDKDRVESVTVDMGVPILQPRLIPVDWADKDMIGAAVEIGGRTWNMTAVSMGNPHAVVFIDDPSEDIEELDLTRIGPLFEKHSLFPDRVNTEFVRIIDRQTLRMRVWERGAGETLACGTGSCASVAAAFLNGRCDRDVVVRLNGGDLKISWRAADQHMIMTGPAEFVFDGVYETEV